MASPLPVDADKVNAATVVRVEFFFQPSHDVGYRPIDRLRIDDLVAEFPAGDAKELYP